MKKINLKKMLLVSEIMKITGVQRYLITQWREAGKIKGQYNDKFRLWEYPESEIEKIKVLKNLTDMRRESNKL